MEKQLEEFNLVIKLRVGTYESTNLKSCIGELFDGAISSIKQEAEWQDAEVLIDKDNSHIRIYGKAEEE